MDLSCWEDAQSDLLHSDRIWHLIILDVYFRRAGYDTDHYLVVAEARERLAKK